MEIPPERMRLPCPTEGCTSNVRLVSAEDQATATDAVSELGMDEGAVERSWSEQWDRIGRWQARVQSTAAGRTHDLTTSHYEDEVYALFQAIHHFKDWLRNDPRKPLPGGVDVEAFVNQNDCLRWCADLANGSKHLSATRRARIDPDLAISQRHYSVKFESGEMPRVSGRFQVTGAGESRDAVALIEECVAVWERFLREHQLLR